MNHYTLFASAGKFGEKDEYFDISATTPEFAITKAKIIKGMDFYSRLYEIAEIIGNDDRGCHFWETVNYLSGYGMYREQMRRNHVFVA